MVADGDVTGLPTLLGGAWVAHLVKRPALGFSSGHDLTLFVGSSPTSGSLLTVWSLLGILSPSLSACPLLALFLLNKNKLKKMSNVKWYVIH